MTTNRDDLEKRLATETLGESKEFTTGVPVDGSIDPTGEYPRRDYFFSSSINKAAIGVKINDLKIGGSSFAINFDIQPQKASVYPFNQVNETPSGHVIEIDDTPGGERVLIKHETGAGIELKPDGSLIINSRRNTVQVSSGDQKVVIGGNGEITYEGSLTLNVTGDYNVNVGGNYNVNAKSSYNEFVGDMKRVEVARNSSEIVREGKQTTIGGNEYKMNLSTLRNVGKGDVENYISGNYKLHNNGDIKISSKKNYAVSAINASMVGEGIYVAGTTGTVGGETVKHYGNLYTGPSAGTGDQTTFYGSLVGKAVEAFTAEFAQKAKEATTARVTQSQSYASDNTSGFITVGNYNPLMTMPWYVESQSVNRMPNATNVEYYLKTSNNGIKDVGVDVDNGIEETINLKARYGYYFRSEPSIHQIRSALRAFNLEELTESQLYFIENLVIEGRLSKFYNNPNPPAINRVIARGPSEYIGYDLLGNPFESLSKKFTAKDKADKIVLNDPRYSKILSRDWNQTLGSTTKLSMNNPLGKFLGSLGDPMSISNLPNDKEDQIPFIDNLRKHAEIVDLVENNTSFANHRLVIAESYSDILPEIEWERGVTGQIAAGKKTGQVAVYKLLNKAGKIDYAKTFDLAVYLKDHAKYQWLVLDYDTFDPSGLLSCQIIIAVPQLPIVKSLLHEYYTHFNQRIMAEELVEIVPV